jgi:hypothetical protein
MKFMSIIRADWTATVFGIAAGLSILGLCWENAPAQPYYRSNVIGSPLLYATNVIVVRDAQSHIKAMREDGSLTNVVNALVADGTFCQVRGHKLELGCGVMGCLVNHPDVLRMRHCPMCGSVQTQEAGPWK